MNVRAPRHLVFPQIRDDQFLTAKLVRSFDARCQYRMAFGRIRSGRPGPQCGTVVLARQIVENGLEEFLDAVKEAAARSGVKDGRVTLGRS